MAILKDISSSVKKVFLFGNIMAAESGPVLLMCIMLLQESQFIADSKCRCKVDFYR
jgi:hypothetical protein